MNCDAQPESRAEGRRGTTLAFTWSNQLVIADDQSAVQRSAKVMPVDT